MLRPAVRFAARWGIFGGAARLARFDIFGGRARGHRPTGCAVAENEWGWHSGGYKQVPLRAAPRPIGIRARHDRGTFSFARTIPRFWRGSYGGQRAGAFGS